MPLQVPQPAPVPATGSEKLISGASAPHLPGSTSWHPFGVYSGLVGQLSAQEWQGAGTRKLVLEHIAQLQNSVAELKEAQQALESDIKKRTAERDEQRELYHTRDKECATVIEKHNVTQRLSSSIEVLYSFSLATGGVLAGLGSWIMDKNVFWPGVFTLLMGVILLLAAALIKWRSLAR